jgi:hydrogenase maturation protease
MSAEGAMSAGGGLGVESSEVEAAVDRMEARMVSPERQKQILVAGVGNAFLSDDGFGGAVAEVLTKREVPGGVTVMDFGTGGLDLAYEVMRGYDALMIIDVSRQGGEPGTLYVMEPDEAEFGGAIEDGEVINPHGMDPKTMLRFVKSVGGWPGKVVIVACEPAGAEALGMELSEDVAAAVERAVDTVLEQIAELQSHAAYEE